jgi:hypothetical protein
MPSFDCEGLSVGQIGDITGMSLAFADRKPSGQAGLYS